MALLAAACVFTGGGVSTALSEEGKDTAAPPAADAQDFLPAFPGAEGFGAGAKGGRGGRVIHVTNLNADGPGSLAAACAEKGPRIVVFDISGVIPAGKNGKLEIPESNITIAGQTAPGAGITLEGRLTCGGLHDVIIRFLRCRPIYGEAGGGDGDCTQLGQVDRMIVDHVSVSWGNDENMDFCGCKNLTVQWTAIEPSRVAFQKSGIHNYGMILGYVAGDATLHHNLWAHHSERAPLCGLDTVDHRNNVIYNVMWALQYHPTSMNRRDKRMYHTNLVGCYFKDGPAGPVGIRPWLPPLNRAVPGISDWKNVQIYGDKNFFDRTGKDGEYCDYDPEVMRGNGIKKGSKYWVAEPWPVPPVTTHDAKEAYRLVLAQTGCLPRDAVSKRTFREVRTGSGYWGRFMPAGGSMEGLTPGTAAPDADNDGMPDEWEKAHDLNPNDAADAVKTVPDGASENDRHKGYTYIEYYVNECADKLVAQAMADAEAAKDEPTARPAPESPAAPPEIAADVKVAGTPMIAVPLAAGGGHIVALPPGGKLCAWGLNWHGELGNGVTTDYELPVEVKQPEGLPSLADVVEISSSGSNIVARTKDGTLLAWGENDLGQVGLGAPSEKQAEPAQVVGPDGKGALDGIVTVSAGAYHTLAVEKDGTVWTWGMNHVEQLGDGTETDRNTPGQVKGPNGEGQLGGVKRISAGGLHNLVLRDDGTLWSWGWNYCSQIGDGTECWTKGTPAQVKGIRGDGLLKDIIAFDGGGAHSVTVQKDGTLLAWGNNGRGQNGQGWTGSICVMDGKFIDYNTFTQQRLNKQGALQVFGAPWPVKVSIGKSPIQAYADNLENGEPWLRVRSALNLAGVGAPAIEALPSLIKAMGDEVVEVRQHSAWALSKLGPAAKDALPALKKALTDAKGRERSNIEDAIKKIESASE